MKGEFIKKYLEQVFKWTLAWFWLTIGITLWIVWVYAINWSWVSTVSSGTNLTANIWNTTMGTFTWAIEILDTIVVKLTWDQTIAWTKTFSNLPISSGSPTQTWQLANKAYVDGVVSAAWGSWQTIVKVGSCRGYTSWTPNDCYPTVPDCPAWWTDLWLNWSYITSVSIYSPNRYYTYENFRTCVKSM